MCTISRCIKFCSTCTTSTAYIYEGIIHPHSIDRNMLATHDSWFNIFCSTHIYMPCNSFMFCTYSRRKHFKVRSLSSNTDAQVVFKVFSYGYFFISLLVLCFLTVSVHSLRLIYVHTSWFQLCTNSIKEF